MDRVSAEVRSGEDDIDGTPIQSAAEHGREPRRNQRGAFYRPIELDEHIHIAAAPRIVQA
ncbi:hypothetical protein TVNIR_0656 [Thioalkalivibrio nitratireducens DSM 14787]|uniref:Uncharacterized protein n=1 Tax=Thioalkalivibrio nitratireducens (strain DSM 14787 / UNIQEM 213 / ALEN2) TaxID=1255043 RepID=L0DTM9_THIND|nr:hypothetical protein TVNIR_0656 [Thioalkalivibrio nitratireducens DSM 14787]